MYLVGFVFVLTIWGLPKPFAAVSQLPAALRLPHTPLDFGSMYLVDFAFGQSGQPRTRADLGGKRR